MQLKINHIYSRKEIGKMLGGSQQTYLPFKDGRVTCGCFCIEEEFNPGAPEEVLFGRAVPMPNVEKVAELVREQDESIPVFIRRASAKWEYVGDYKCVDLSRDVVLLNQKMEAYPRRGKITGVLRFESV